MHKVQYIKLRNTFIFEILDRTQYYSHDFLYAKIVNMVALYKNKCI